MEDTYFLYSSLTVPQQEIKSVFWQGHVNYLLTSNDIISIHSSEWDTRIWRTDIKAREGYHLLLEGKMIRKLPLLALAQAIATLSQIWLSSLQSRSYEIVSIPCFMWEKQLKIRRTNQRFEQKPLIYIEQYRS